MTSAPRHHAHPPRRRLAALGFGLLLATTAAACGTSSGGEGAADDDTSDEVASLGTDAPDDAVTLPSTGDDDTAGTNDLDGDSETDGGTDSSGDTDTSGGTDDESAGTSDESERSPEDAMLAFSQCMREHGVEDYPDPDFSGDGGGRIEIRVDASNEEEMREAQEACEPIMEEIRSTFEPPDPEEIARMREEMLEFAECMREHGIDFPDPVVSDDGMVTVQAGGPPGERPEGPSVFPPENDPEFEAAQEACGGGMPMPARGGGE